MLKLLGIKLSAISVLLLCSIVSSAWFHGTADPAPSQAAAVGYINRIFFDDFNSASTIDLTNSKVNGFNWYITNWFSSSNTNANQLSISNSVLTIGSGTGTNPNIVTSFDAGAGTYKGTVFGNGAYFEIRMKFDPSLSGGSAAGIPNFFGMAIEHIYDSSSNGDAHWPGQASGYAHFIEVDFFEPLTSSTTTYNGSIHDWGGIYNGTVFPQNIFNGGNNVITVGAINFNQFHTYGTLWVPQAGSTPGYILRYFDNTLVQSIYYLGPPGSPPLPGNAGQSFTPSTAGAADRTYSVLDNQRLSLSLGGGRDWPIQVDWVKVWR